jgi:hypothetical protein
MDVDMSTRQLTPMSQIVTRVALILVEPSSTNENGRTTERPNESATPLHPRGTSLKLDDLTSTARRIFNRN